MGLIPEQLAAPVALDTDLRVAWSLPVPIGRVRVRLGATPPPLHREYVVATPWATYAVCLVCRA